jgi:hypothetical protein
MNSPSGLSEGLREDGGNILTQRQIKAVELNQIYGNC